MASVQIGTVIASDKKAADRWARMRNPRPVPSDAAIEAQIATIARMFPANVERVQA